MARIRLDNAKEFTGAKWTEFTTEKGITCEYISPYSPEQNGIAERYNRTLAVYARAIIHNKDIPYILWPYIFESVAYILNRTYNKTIKKTPYEALLESKPDISNIRVLESLIYTLLPKTRRDSKLDPVSEKGILIGFKSTNYRIYIPEREAIFFSRDITILEDQKYPFNIEEDILETDEEIIPQKSSISIEVPPIQNPEQYQDIRDIEESSISETNIEEQTE
jgi:hypothetical protein